MRYPLPTVTRTPAGRVCAYCGEPALTGADRQEHPLPAAIGSSLTIDTVCDPCNTWAGVHVDQPFLADDWLRMTWAEHDLRIGRRRGRGRVASPLRHGFTPDGVRVVADENWRPRLGSKIIEGSKPGELHIHAGSMEEAERLIERIKERAAREGKQIQLKAQSVTQIQPLVNINLTVDTGVWSRMGAKLALACGSIAYPEDWRSSGVAEELRRRMRDPEYRDSDGNLVGILAQRIDETNAFRMLVDPPEHLLCFMPTTPVGLGIVLFGELFFGLPAEGAGHERPTMAWRIDPRSASASVETTFDGLMYRLFERLDDASSSAASQDRRASATATTEEHR